MGRSKLTEEQIAEKLGDVPQWELADGKLQRSFKFGDFVEAWGFMSRVALLAESMDHHPDWSNVYSTVKIALNTHDVGGLSDLDFELARKIDAL